jgi:hypothetical protein
LGRFGERGDGLEALEPEILPETGARVFRMPPRLLEAAFGLPRDGLDIGRVAVGLRAPFRLSREALPRGIGIFGRPGTGKSYAAGVLIEEIHKLGIPSLIIDVNGETIGAARRLGGRHAGAGAQLQDPLRYLEFSELEALLPNLTEVQRDLISAAFEELLEKDEDFGVEDLASKIEEIGGQLQARLDAVGRAVAQGPPPGPGSSGLERAEASGGGRRAGGLGAAFRRAAGRQHIHGRPDPGAPRHGGGPPSAGCCSPIGSGA